MAPLSAGDAGGITRNGLRVDLDKQAAWQRRAAIRYAAKKRARRTSARLTTRIDRRAGTDWPAAVRRSANRRSGGVCELDQERPATHLHHRKARRFGDHRICNALHLCETCHQSVHRRRRLAEASGWIVRSHLDPAIVPVELADGAVRVLLTLDGDYQEAA